MTLIFAEPAWEDYQYWQRTDRKVLKRINLLIREASRDPFRGIGKPEPLRNELKGWWSRRIDKEHRMVYRPTPQGLQIAQLRYHY